jgi:hypothetical protein
VHCGCRQDVPDRTASAGTDSESAGNEFVQILDGLALSNVHELAVLARLNAPVLPYEEQRLSLAIVQSGL